jgi:hypothetical protein
VKGLLYSIIIFLGLVWTANAQSVPKILWGRWVVRRELPTTTIACWGEHEAKGVIGTEVEYSSELFRWNKIIAKNPQAQTTVISASRFHDENSGGGANDSQVTFRQLGIKAETATQIVIRHPPANVTIGTIEIPGDFVLVKDRNTIIIAACNVYFEAKRSESKHTQ